MNGRFFDCDFYKILFFGLLLPLFDGLGDKVEYVVLVFVVFKLLR